MKIDSLKIISRLPLSMRRLSWQKNSLGFLKTPAPPGETFSLFFSRDPPPGNSIRIHLKKETEANNGF
ncbi:hypothetical protein ABH19_01730 [Leptospirillum sp. Group II 'CF-1']|nr:hypothetical protein ABH19_01730 [Leptospirillum sp. Group II 'CF-1']